MNSVELYKPTVKGIDFRMTDFRNFKKQAGHRLHSLTLARLCKM